MEAAGEMRASGWEWFAARAHGRRALLWLILLSFLEPIFLPLFPETLMGAMILAGREKWKKYAAITTLSSALGGIAGYLIGAFLFHRFGEALLFHYNLHHSFSVVQTLLWGNVFLVMLFLIVSPIPDKVVVLLAGALHVPFLPFALGFLCNRLLRFGTIAYLVSRFGQRALTLVREYFELFAISVVLLIALALLRALGA